MARHSAGILPFRVAADGRLELFLVHPGGPLWATRDEHAWSVAKGEYGPDEDARAVAEREFAEEVGVAAPPGARVELGELRQASGKRVTVWAVEAPGFSVASVQSNEFEMEWPPRSGRVQSFPEIDRAEWIPAATARRKLVRGQAGFLDRLVEVLAARGVHVREGEAPRADEDETS